MAVERTTRAEHPLPAVLMHWAHVLALAVLIFTGFQLYYPFLMAPLGLIRAVHMTAAYVLLITVVLRIYWAFFGAGSAGGGSSRLVPDWTHFAPERANKGQALETLKYYLFLRDTHPRSAKFNTLQKGTYVVWLLLIIGAAATGFALWGPTGQILLPRAYTFGGPVWMRSLHYLIMWGFICTLMIHIYLSFAEASAQVWIMFLWKTNGGPARPPAQREHA